jgi:hypothetical protein
MADGAILRFTATSNPASPQLQTADFHSIGGAELALVHRDGRDKENCHGKSNGALWAIWCRLSALSRLRIPFIPLTEEFL